MVESGAGGVKAPDGSPARCVEKKTLDLRENGDRDRPMSFAVNFWSASWTMSRPRGVEMAVIC
jgi:hypothetical protein